ncbi:uncharacterized protein LOC107266475 isoform X2 [Cephus cinctus]|uniref:Uncharacterized protein LOC107266475 isoform X2 n=1 Tax=Cephus cinctus TaxID=211228 RepID=A0AAJ7BRA0_CEPCN|nr:uncharacterized protein LOC107266475 isoform X2 [Cephus cinctus]
MPSSSPSCCCVPGCKTGYASVNIKNRMKGKKNCSIFKPRTEEMLLKWREAIPRSHKAVSKSNGVCELHFQEDEVEKYYVTTMPDGTVFRMRKGKATLRVGSVPSIFPCHQETGISSANECQSKGIQETVTDEHKLRNMENSSQITPQPTTTTECKSKNDDATSSQSKFKDAGTNSQDFTTCVPCTSSKLCEPSDQWELCESSEQCEPCESSELTIPSDECEPSEIDELCGQCDQSSREFEEIIKSTGGSFQSLKQKLNTIVLPRGLWFMHVLENRVFWICLQNNSSAIAKRVVLLQDLSVEIFLEEKRIILADMEHVEKIDEVSKLLQRVSALIPCKGVLGEQKSLQCIGYVLAKEQNRTGPQITRCTACRKQRRSLMKRPRGPDQLKIQQEKRRKIQAIEQQCKQNSKQKDSACISPSDKDVDSKREQKNLKTIFSQKSNIHM